MIDDPCPTGNQCLLLCAANFKLVSEGVKYMLVISVTIKLHKTRQTQQHGANC